MSATRYQFKLRKASVQVVLEGLENLPDNPVVRRAKEKINKVLNKILAHEKSLNNE